MKKATKTLYHPQLLTKGQRKFLHNLDAYKGIWDKATLAIFTKEVPRPRMIELGGKRVQYTGP